MQIKYFVKCAIVTNCTRNCKPSRTTTFSFSVLNLIPKSFVGMETWTLTFTEQCNTLTKEK